jgi:hypothetical protein
MAGKPGGRILILRIAKYGAMIGPAEAAVVARLKS